MSSAAQAREKAGLTLEEAAQRARITTKYLQAIEKRGGASYGLATRLARMYRVNATVFLYRPSERAKSKQTTERHQAKKPDAEKPGTVNGI